MIGVGIVLLQLLLQAVRAEKRNKRSAAQEPIASPDPICDPTIFSIAFLDGVTVLSLSATPHRDYSTSPLEIVPSIPDLNFCEVNIHLTHANADDDVLVRVWLPSTARAGLGASRSSEVDGSQQVWALSVLLQLYNKNMLLYLQMEGTMGTAGLVWIGW